MAVTKVKLLDSSGGESLKDVGYELRYLVSTDEPLKDGPLTIRSAVPWRLGDPYAIGNESDPFAQVSSFSERQVSSSDFSNWVVGVSFKNPDSENKDNSNPLNDPVEVELAFEHASKRTWVDGKGTIVCNTAGELYPDGLEMEDNLPTLNYTLNQAFFSSTTAMMVRNGVNKTAWKGFPPYTMKVSTIKARTQFHPRIGLYYQCQYSFGFAGDEIALRTISSGFNEVVDRTGGNIKLERIKVGNVVTTVPWPLDTNGKACQRVEQTINGKKQIVFTPTPQEQVFVKGTPVDFNTMFGFL